MRLSRASSTSCLFCLNHFQTNRSTSLGLSVDFRCRIRSEGTKDYFRPQSNLGWGRNARYVRLRKYSDGIIRQENRSASLDANVFRCTRDDWLSVRGGRMILLENWRRIMFAFIFLDSHSERIEWHIIVREPDFVPIVNFSLFKVLQQNFCFKHSFDAKTFLD